MNQPTGASIMARAREAAEGVGMQLAIINGVAATLPPIMRVAVSIGLVALTAREAYEENVMEGWREKMDAIIAQSPVKFANLLVCESEDINDRRIHGQLLGRVAREFIAHIHEMEAKAHGLKVEAGA